MLSRAKRTDGRRVIAAKLPARSTDPTRSFDLLLGDNGLPDRSGLELMKEIAARHQIPGIAMSGFAMDSDIARCKEAGFSEHLAKPVDFETLDAVPQRVAGAE
jgi:CheY-like chemotaxis protein